MVIHSDSGLGILFFFLVFLIAALLVLIAGMSLLVKQYRFAGKALGIGGGFFAAYVLAVIVASALMPQQIVKIGDMYCDDIWCLSIQNVHTVPSGQDTEYTLDVHLYSDADTVTVSSKGVRWFLVDERGRRFPMVASREPVPIDVLLKPHETVSTAMTFVTPSDVRSLYLAADDSGHKIPLLARVFVSLYFGSDTSLLHKPTLLRVL